MEERQGDQGVGDRKKGENLDHCLCCITVGKTEQGRVNKFSLKTEKVRELVT